MTSTPPVAGSVLRLCLSVVGRERPRSGGRQGSPCVVLGVEPGDSGEAEILVVAVTHTPPHDSFAAVAIREDQKRALGLDDGLAGS